MNELSSAADSLSSAAQRDSKQMILIGIGSNLASREYASSAETAAAAAAEFPPLGIEVIARSRWYRSEPVPASDQPWFVNAVAVIATGLEPATLLDRLLALEARFGRVRGAANADRTLDLDLLDYDGQRLETERLVLPHPRLHRRRFVLAPLCELAPDWRHPVFGLTASALLAGLAPGQPVFPINDGPARG
jgi:2-amino-4-hydroxy-6-hydroxymethyldihydropteridine diphosphokinase